MSAAKKPSHNQLGFISCSQRAVVIHLQNGTLQSPGDTGRCVAARRLALSLFRCVTRDFSQQFGQTVATHGPHARISTTTRPARLVAAMLMRWH